MERGGWIVLTGTV